MRYEPLHLHYTTNRDPYAEPFSSDEIDACIAEINALEVTDPEAPWYLDGGATHHISGNQNV